MKPFSRFRLYHWLLVLLFATAFITGDDAGLLHVWLGYGLVAVLVWRLFAAILRLRGFASMLPSWRGWSGAAGSSWGRLLVCGMVLLMAGTLYTGVALVDNAAALSEGLSSVLPSARADDGVEATGSLLGLGDSEELHEVLANASLLLIGLHIGWLLVYRRQQVWAMFVGSRAVAASASADTTGAVSRAMQLTVVAIEQETADTRSFRLAIPAALRTQLAFLPGQYLTVRVPLPGGAVWRCYSLSGLPGEDTLRITVRQLPNGAASSWLHLHLAVGDSLTVLPPAGRFVPHSLDDDMLLLAAGCGITPLYSILQAVLQQGHGKVKLVYSCSQPEQAIFLQALLQLQQAYPQRFCLHWHASAQQGRLDSAVLGQLAAGWLHAQAFICGPEAFMTLVEQTLLQQGMASARVHLERFSHVTGRQGAGQSSQLRVHDQGRTHAVTVAAGEVLLDAMQRSGLQPRHDCRAGLCGSCRCRVEKGQVQLHSNQVLTDEELAAGWTLACQAEACSDELEIRYEH